MGILFGLWHLMNPGYNWVGILSCAVQGMLFGYAYFRCKSTLMPIGLHAGRNFILSNLLLCSWFFKITYKGTSVNEFTGAEGTVAGMVLPLLACFAVYYWTRKNN